MCIMFSRIITNKYHALCGTFSSALEQKKTIDKEEFGAIDYDAPVKSEKKKIGLGTQVNLFCYALSNPYNQCSRHT